MSNWRWGRGAIALIIVLVATLGMMVGVMSAQDMGEGATYEVIVGGSGPANTDLTAFFPSYLQVHQGDTIVYTVLGFHNVRFGSELLPLVTMTEHNGAPQPEMNPAVVFPSSMEPGPVSFDGSADVNSGLPDPAAPAPFVVIMNAEPGVYSVFCDVHPGMVQAVEVVAADVEIPSPREAEQTAGMEMGAMVGLAMGQYFEMLNTPAETTDSGVKVLLGQPGGSRAEIWQFFPFVVEIDAGQSVTWEVPADHAGAHVVGWPPLYGQDVTIIPRDAGPPLIAPGPALLPSGPENGGTIAAGEAFNSGLLEPGQSFSLTFSESGVYPTICSLHPGMQGVVVVR